MKKRIKILQSHIEAGDYFGTLATILDLSRQKIIPEEEGEKILRGLIDDLLYLQEHFDIVRK